MVQDQLLAQAVAAIPQRSERQQDLHKLVGSFVDVGILPQIRNVNNQVIYGRRGTGKTHVLRVFASELSQTMGNAVLYIDARTLGSTSQFADPNIPLAARCVALFRDILGEVYNCLLDYIVNNAPSAANIALDRLTDLSTVITDPVLSYSAQSITARAANKITEKGGVELAVGVPAAASFKASSGLDSATENEQTTSYSVAAEDKVIFPALTSLLSQILQLTNSRLILLIDEWSSLPLDIQPYLAEFVKRGFLSLAAVITKIASLEYRSDFGLETAKGFIGFEMGADVSAAIDIDDYYVFDRNPSRITEAFGDMLYKHIVTELAPQYLATTYQVSNGLQFTRKLFSDSFVFQELVRSSEGVARDLINIFSLAYFSAYRRSKDKIDTGAVIEAARLWFEQDKMRNLDETLQGVLRRIVEEVIGNRKARSFLLPRELGNHPVIQRLFDLRILHLVQRGYADKDKPGVRYNIYTLDYGTYVDLMNTSKRPDLGFSIETEGDANDFIVPFDDKRSIRRIVLTEQILA